GQLTREKECASVLQRDKLNCGQALPAPVRDLERRSRHKAVLVLIAWNGIEVPLEVVLIAGHHYSCLRYAVQKLGEVRKLRARRKDAQVRDHKGHHLVE